ncbi:MAG: hypothetical protein ACR2RV_02835 [Verrucomicrobiales bacterium]
MKTNNFKSALSGLALFVSLSGIALADDCETVGASVKKDVAKTPSKVLVIVDEAISKNESCACEIVKAAIEAADAKKDGALVREIVVTAVNSAQGMAATIAECAVAVSPSSAAEIKSGLSEVFEGASGGAKSAYYSSKGGKEVVEEVEDFGPEPVVISGVYLIAPVAPSASSIYAVEELEQRQEDLLRLLRRELQRRGRDTGDGGTTRPVQS